MRMGIWALTLAVPLGFGWTWYRSAECGDPAGTRARWMARWGENPAFWTQKTMATVGLSNSLHVGNEFEPKMGINLNITWMNGYWIYWIVTEARPTSLCHQLVDVGGVLLHTSMHACRQAGRKAGRQEGRQTDRQTYIRGWVKTYQFINFRVLKVLTQPHIKTARGKRPLAKHLVGRLVGPWGGGILT